MIRAGPRRFALAGTYAALVDILLATMGIFVVVFTQLHLEDAPRLVPKPVDGVIACIGDEMTLYQGPSTSSSPVQLTTLTNLIREIWPNGARLLAVQNVECSQSENGRALFQLETQIRLLDAVDSAYMIDVAPISQAQSGPASLAQILERLEANTEAKRRLSDTGGQP